MSIATKNIRHRLRRTILFLYEQQRFAAPRVIAKHLFNQCTTHDQRTAWHVLDNLAKRKIVKKVLRRVGSRMVWCYCLTNEGEYYAYNIIHHPASLKDHL